MPAPAVAAVLPSAPPRCACEDHELSIWQPDPTNPSLVFAWCLDCSRLYRVRRRRPPRGSSDPDRWRILFLIAAAPSSAAG